MRCNHRGRCEKPESAVDGLRTNLDNLAARGNHVRNSTIKFEGEVLAFVTPTNSEAEVGAPDGVAELGQLGDVLTIFPEGRAAVATMNSKIMGQGVLDPSIRSLIGAATANKWADPLQLERHLGAFASQRGVSVDDAQAMLNEPEQSDLNPAEQALLQYVNKAATEPFKMVERDVEALAAQGWSERETVEAVTVICNVAYLAVANVALGVAKGSN